MKKEDGMTTLNLLLTIVITVIIAGVIFAMVYQKPTNNTNVNENTNTDNSNENNSNTDTKNEYQNIVLNSRVGLRILEKFKISNIYSDMLYNEIDSNGLSNKAKLLFTYITIIADTDKYSGLLRVSEDYTGNYITKADFESVAKSLFGKDTKLTHGNVVGENTYDKENENYVVMPIGFAGESIDFTLEVPYEIKEYNDRVEVSFYRVYCNQYTDTESIEGKMYTKLYYDKNRTIEIENTDSEEMLDPETQATYITNKINNGSIDKLKLETKVYTLKNEDGNYVIVK